MSGVEANRLRWGALAWLLTLQFFVVETIAELRFDGPYSRIDDVISDLGSAEAAEPLLMNGSFVAQAALILAGLALLRPALRTAAGGAAVVLLEIAAVGVLLVGIFPSDGNAALHQVGAVLYLAGGALAVIALAYTVRPRSEAVGTALALLGLIGSAATVFFLTGVTGYLGEGGTERAAAYVLPLALAVAGVGLWRLPEVRADAVEAADDGAPPTRREERQRARAERARRELERDAALEEAAARRARSRPAGDEEAGEEAGEEAEDPWAPAPRDRDGGGQPAR
jgi:hypothetical membrane protein